ncbi:hypothetical protein PFISCL1PPCAC_9107, partial [Pristionchus fissidentatus]
IGETTRTVDLEDHRTWARRRSHKVRLSSLTLVIKTRRSQPTPELNHRRKAASNSRVPMTHSPTRPSHMPSISEGTASNLVTRNKKPSM